MKTVVTFTIIFTLSFFSVQNVQAQKTVTATVVNVTSNQGKVYFSLYKKEGFMQQPIQSKGAIIKDGKSTVIFTNVPAGEYAVICYHDKNNNLKMDFEENGMPLEDYGASNNILSMGPPQYDDAKFVVTDKNVSLAIKF